MPRSGSTPPGGRPGSAPACGGGRRPAGRGQPPPGPGRAGGPGRAPDAPRGHRAARGSDGELAPAPRPAEPAGRERSDEPGLHPQGGDRAAHRATDGFRAPDGRAGTAARAADDLYPDAGDRDLLEARRPRESGPDPLPGRRRAHPGPRGHHRPALEPVAHPAGLAQGPGAGDDRHARGPGDLRRSTG